MLKTTSKRRVSCFRRRHVTKPKSIVLSLYSTTTTASLFNTYTQTFPIRTDIKLTKFKFNIWLFIITIIMDVFLYVQLVLTEFICEIYFIFQVIKPLFFSNFYTFFLSQKVFRRISSEKYSTIIIVINTTKNVRLFNIDRKLFHRFLFCIVFV